MAVIATECEVGPKPKLHIPDIFADIQHMPQRRIWGGDKQDFLIVFKA